MFRPRIFLSYANSKSAHEATTNAVVGSMRLVLGANGVEVVDPITTDIREYARISADVIRDIQRSDAMFVIEYPPVLNTCYEAGIALSFGIPSFHWLADDPRPAEEREGLRAYLDYLGYRDGAMQLTEDQGDLLYRVFPGDIASNPSARVEFEDQIRKCLDSLKDGPLAEHTIRVRRKYREAARLGMQMLREYTESKALSWVLNSLLTQHQRHLQQGLGSKRFEVDDSFYPTFLATLGEHDESARAVFAVADISSNIERFWFKGGAKHVVGGRIFRLPWKDFYSDKLGEFLDVARGLAEAYPVYVTDADSREGQLQHMRTGISGDFVVFESVVGYYVRDTTESTKLVVEHNERLSKELKREFDLAVKVSAQVDMSSTAEDIKRLWLDVRRIGEWDERYEGGHQRDKRYYDNYDKHIRAWIPNYDELVSKVAGAVIAGLSSKSINGKALVGEIGSGTGAVTSIVAGWCAALDRAGFEPIWKYFCIDSSEEMCKATRRVLSGVASEHRFQTSRDSDFQGLRACSGGRKFDIVCGSLMLHYIVEPSGEAEGWRHFMRDLDSILDHDGIAVFGGCFFDADDSRRDQEIEWWQRWMEIEGLETSIARKFIAANVEMCAMPSPSMIAEYAGGSFGVEFQRVGPRSSPFGVLTLARPGVASSAMDSGEGPDQEDSSQRNIRVDQP